jgi:4-amino-4-deoxy-L-arabinose transferase-like glycosyltransferase
MSQAGSSSWPGWHWLNRIEWPALVLILAGFWIRLSFMLGEIYHIDEFISMLAAVMVAERGLPILPSGLFYDHGLLFSFFSGAFVALSSFKEEVARWPALLSSVLTIAVYFTAARRLFGSRPAGLLAATLVALDELSMVWGARARMYTQAHFFVLLSLALLLESTLKQPSPRRRYWFLFFLAAALLSHTVTFLILAPLAATLLLFTIFYRRDWLWQRYGWLQAIVAGGVVAGALVVVALGQTGSTVSLQDPNAAATAPAGLDFLQGFFAPGLFDDRFDDLLDFFQTPAYAWLLPLLALSLLVSLYRLLRRRTTFADIVVLFLTLFVVLVILEQATLLTGNWRKARYLFMIALPAFFLLSAQSLALIGQGMYYLISLPGRSAASLAWAKTLTPLWGVALIIFMWGADAWDTAHAQGAGNYNTAFEFVGENWQPGDKVMTVHPSAAYLYAGHSDYYANQVSAKVIDDEEDTPLDRYTGTPLIDSVEKFNQVLRQSRRVWFVVDDSRLYRRYEPFFTQQIFAQMDHLQSWGGVIVFISKLHPRPAAAEPMVRQSGNFNDLIHLEGYSLDPATITPDGLLPVTLFWRPAIETPPPVGVPKVFTQLRNNQGETIAQADHFIYEGLLTLHAWQDLYKANEWLRDTADLQLPLPLPVEDGPYQIYIGLYNPATFERVPLLNDASGENAVVLSLPALP